VSQGGLVGLFAAALPCLEVEVGDRWRRDDGGEGHVFPWGLLGGVLWGQSLMSLLVKVVSACRDPCLICIAKTGKVNVN